MKNKTIMILIAAAIILAVGLIIYFFSQKKYGDQGIVKPTADVTCEDAQDVAKKITEIWGDSKFIKDGNFLDEIMPLVTEDLYAGFRAQLANGEDAEDDFSINLKSNKCENTKEGARVTIEAEINGEQKEEVLLEVDVVNLEGEATVDGFSDTYK